MRLTDITIVCPKARQYRKAITLQETLTRRLEYHTKNNKDQINWSHKSRYNDLMQYLTNQIALLDRDELISHPSLGIALTKPVKALTSWVFEGLPDPGKAQHDEITAALVELMNNKGRDSRAAQHKFNLAAEIAYRTNQSWYLIFNTLTVAPGKYYHVFEQQSTEFKDYIRRVQRSIDAAESRNGHHAKIYRQPDGTNHTYFACVEEGSINGRLHIHVLHFCRTLPDKSNDPNRGKLRPVNRQISILKNLWPNGHSLPIAVRYSPLDAYGQAGWRWPFDLRTGNALQIRSPLALASYMSKYITKSYTSCKRTQLLWRVRKSHNLGKQIMETLVSPLSKPALMYLATNTTIKLTLNNNRIPPALLRQTALRRYLNHPSTQNINNSKTHLMAEAANTMPLPSLLHSFRGSTTQTQQNNRQNITTILTSNLLREVTFKQLWQEIKQTTINVDETYYRRSNHTYGTTSTSDYFTSTHTVTRKISATQSRDRSLP